jgi:N-formylglutamate deformylase
MDLFHLIVGDAPLVAAAIHCGHYVRPEVAERLAISEAERLREEDPFTDQFIDWAPTRIVGRRSRYEFDLNRPRGEAVYLNAEQCWGVDIWREAPGDALVARSLMYHDTFYSIAESLLRKLVETHGRVVVLDVHSYNHRRDGADAPPAAAETHPEVNIGTGSMNRAQWASLVDGFISDFRSYEYFGRSLDVRENIKFRGGYFCRWIHDTFPTSVCALAVEFKKTFMDEWSGESDGRQLNELRSALQSTTQRLLERLARLGSPHFSTRHS